MIPAVQREQNGAALVQRIRSEYLEMPGLALTLRQAGRLWYLDEPTCAEILADLIRSGFLRRTWRGTFVRI